MPALTRKLFRDLWHIRGQALAIALVIGCGIGMFVLSKSSLASLDHARDSYYQHTRLAHIVAPVVRAPVSITRDIAALNGVARVESRVRASALLDVPGYSAPVSAQVLSLPAYPGQAINDLVLRQGYWPRPSHPDRVLLLESFASAHNLHVGDRLDILLMGRKLRLQVAGMVLSAEHIYAIPPGDIVPDDRRYGVLWMSREALATALNLDGATNDILVRLEHHSTPALESEIIRRIDRLLEPYGAIGAYGRNQQISDQFLSNEIQQLETMSWALPPIFLLVSGFLLQIVVSRLIATERENIGLLKAFGYTGRTVAGHYLALIGIIAVGGALLGIGMGIGLAQGLNQMYLQYFKFPELRLIIPPSAPLISVVVSLAIAALSTRRAVMDSARLQPAVAMAPPAPPDYSAGLRQLEQLGTKLSLPARMVMRHLLRWPGRALMTLLGIALSMALLIGSSFSLDAIRHLVDVSFNLADRQDVRVSFTEPQPERILLELSRLPGVLQSEGFTAASVRMQNGVYSRNEGIIGMDANPELGRLIDEDYRPVTIPEQGLLLSRSLAQRLSVSRGELVTVTFREGERHTYRLPVAGIVESYIGTGAYMRRAALNALAGTDTVLSGANLAVDPDHLAALYDALKSTPRIAGVALLNEAQVAFHETLQESVGTMIFFNTLFAGLIVIGVVYNSARVSLSERGRELASLRVLGLSRIEVSRILLNELWLLALSSLPLGAALGWGLAWGLTLSLDTELFRIPLVIENRTYAYGALIVCLATFVSGWIVRYRVRRLDLVSVLKTRE